LAWSYQIQVAFYITNTHLYAQLFDGSIVDPLAHSNSHGSEWHGASYLGISQYTTFLSTLGNLGMLQFRIAYRLLLFSSFIMLFKHKQAYCMLERCNKLLTTMCKLDQEELNEQGRGVLFIDNIFHFTQAGSGMQTTHKCYGHLLSQLKIAMTICI